jgi:hypothetical protein
MQWGFSEIATSLNPDEFKKILPASSLHVLVYKCLKIAGVFMNKSFKADASPMCIVGDGFIDMHATCRSIMNTKP